MAERTWQWRPAGAGWLALLAALGACRQPTLEETPSLTAASHPATAAALPAAVPAAIQLRDVTASTGITFRHFDGASGRKYLPEPMSAGLALLDYDGDGLIDIYFLSGAPLPPLPADPHCRSALYRNEGNFRFKDVTEEAGVGSTGFGLGVAAVDFDNDGDLDLYVNNFGPNTLYRNNGDGTFTEITSQTGVGVGDDLGAGVAFLDADADGDLDLFVANYMRFTLAINPTKSMDGFPTYPGPQDFDPNRSAFFLNDGTGGFLDASVAAGIAGVAGSGMGVIAADYDNDGDTDLLVANDERANFLFENDGRGKFTEVGVLRGFAYGFDGRPRGHMGLDGADIDHNGWLDFFVTTFSKETCVLYHNAGGQFEDATARTGAGAGSLPHAEWGTGFADFDNDADADLFIACGQLDPEVHRWRPYTAYRIANLLLENTGGKFEDISSRCGDGLAPVLSSRGSGIDDLDNDGDVDLVVLNSTDLPTVLRNDSRTGGHWLQVQLIGRRSNRGGIGAQVRIATGGLTQLAEVHSGRGYQSHYGTRLHFGLRSAERVERIEVRWIGGGTDVLTDVPAGQLLRIVEGTTNPQK